MKRIPILDVLPGETEEQAAERMKPAPEMAWGLFRGKVVAAVWRIMADADTRVPGSASADAAATLEAMLCDYSITRDLIPLLRTPPQVCPRCGKPFRSLDVPQPMCRDCRDAADKARERAEIEASVRAEMTKGARA